GVKVTEQAAAVGGWLSQTCAWVGGCLQAGWGWGGGGGGRAAAGVAAPCHTLPAPLLMVWKYGNPLLVAGAARLGGLMGVAGGGPGGRDGLVLRRAFRGVLRQRPAGLRGRPGREPGPQSAAGDGGGAGARQLGELTERTPTPMICKSRLAGVWCPGPVRLFFS